MKHLFALFLLLGTITAVSAQSTDRYWDMAESAYDKGDYYAAIEHYSTVISMDPNDMNARYNRGLSYQNVDNYESSIADFKAVANNDNTDWEAWYYLAYAEFETGDYEGAVEHYTKALNINPSDEDAWHNRGSANYNLYNDPEACADWEKAAELGSDDAPAKLEKYCGNTNYNSGSSSNSDRKSKLYGNSGSSGSVTTSSDFCTGVNYVLDKMLNNNVTPLKGKKDSEASYLFDVFEPTYIISGMEEIEVQDVLLTYAYAGTVSTDYSQKNGEKSLTEWANKVKNCIGSGYTMETKEESSYLKTITFTPNAGGASMIDCNLKNGSVSGEYDVEITIWESFGY